MISQDRRIAVMHKQNIEMQIVIPTQVGSTFLQVVINLSHRNNSPIEHGNPKCEPHAGWEARFRNSTLKVPQHAAPMISKSTKTQ